MDDHGHGWGGGPHRKGRTRNPMMNVQGKSDLPIVPAKSPNNAASAAAEAMEGRGGAKGNARQSGTRQTQGWESVSPALERIRDAARRDKRARFTALLHHVSVDLLRFAAFQLKKAAAPGVDGVTWAAFEADLENNLQDLHERVQRGAYRAKPSRRQFIPKPDGRKRPLGIAALEDKIVQRAVGEVLNAIYETDFLGFSYGFRPGRSQHDALDALAAGISERKVRWIVDADIRSFFDSMSHEWLMRFLEHRVADRRLLRLIGKWLKAGVLEDGRLIATEQGSPQGAVISPLLANIYLHYVYDLWVRQWRKQNAHGDMIVVRYADDTVVGFLFEHDARQFLADLVLRLEQFGLQLHPDKTRTIAFGRFALKWCRDRGHRPETFNFLGFTHICGVNRRGKFILRRHTMRERLGAKLREIKQALRRMMHKPIHEQGAYVKRVVNGWLNYFAVPTNNRAVSSFYRHVAWYWFRTLRRRSQTRTLNWAGMKRFTDRWLPPARLRHPLPNVRFRVRTQGGSPVR